MNVRKTKATETEIAEISGIEAATVETITEAELEECSNYDCATAFEYGCGTDEEYAPTPLQQGYYAWIERKQREKLYGKNMAEEVNLFEELVYSCLQNGSESCRQILR